jgi:hypothetical protein
VGIDVDVDVLVGRLVAVSLSSAVCKIKMEKFADFWQRDQQVEE